MDTTELIIDAIYGIDEVNDTEGSCTCDYGGYSVRIEWAGRYVSITEVKKNGNSCKLPSNINKELLTDVVKEKIREISQKKMKKREQTRKLECRENMKKQSTGPEQWPDIKH